MSKNILHHNPTRTHTYTHTYTPLKQECHRTTLSLCDAFRFIHFVIHFIRKKTPTWLLLTKLILLSINGWQTMASNTLDQKNKLLSKRSLTIRSVLFLWRSVGEARLSLDPSHLSGTHFLPSLQTHLFLQLLPLVTLTSAALYSEVKKYFWAGASVFSKTARYPC